MLLGVVDIITVTVMKYRVQNNQHAIYMMGLQDDARNTQFSYYIAYVVTL